MPKAARQKTRGHNQAVRPSKRQYAVQENQVEHIDIGAAEDVPAPDLLDAISAESSSQGRSLTKKAKKMLKHESLIERLEASRSPYSKSHSRRLRRKAKEQIGGGLSDIQAAIADVEDDAPELIQTSIREAAEAEARGPKAPTNEPRVKFNPGLIGEGKGAPLSKAQRKKALELERKRHPLILGNPAYSANPFETIRAHAQNTLLKHQLPV